MLSNPAIMKIRKFNKYIKNLKFELKVKINAFHLQITIVMNEFSNIQNTFNKIHGYLHSHNFRIIEKITKENSNEELILNLLVQRANIEQYRFNISLFKPMKTFFSLI